VNPLSALFTGLAFAAVNAAHCAGMCGVFAMKAGAPPGGVPGLLVYGLGKTCTYVFFGALAGWLGAEVLGSSGTAQAVLGFGAAGLMAAAGIAKLCRPAAGSTAGTTAVPFLAPLVVAAGRPDSPGGRFTLGALTGALPCGVVYFAALQAAAAGSRLASVALMAGFAVGTMPVLGVVALLGRGILARVPARAARVASGVLLLLLGIVAGIRAAVPLLGEDGPASCCH
jgi:hypothetical protein